MNSAARYLNPDPGLQGVCEGPEFRTSGLLLWQKTRTSLHWPRASRWHGSQAWATLSHPEGKAKAVRSPPLRTSRLKWQASLCGRWAEPGQAWKGTGITWSPWKGIPEREAFELKSQRIQPVFDDDSYNLRRTAQCSNLCGAEALECQGNPV